MDVLRLLALLREYRGPIRADFRREYGLDIDQVIEERSMRPSVVLDLIDNLSPQAALWRAINPDSVWTLEAMLLAAVVDELRAYRWEFSRVNFKGRQRPPDPIPRPGVTPPVDKQTFGGRESALPLDEMAAWLGERWTGPTDE